MSNLKKCRPTQVRGLLLHNTRENPYPSSNEDIDPTRTHLNHHLVSIGSTYEKAWRRYKRLIGNTYVYGRDDVKTLCSWCVSQPKDLSPDQEELFWKETLNFLNSKYEKKNCIMAVVHYDERVFNPITKSWVGAKAHLHYCWVPRVPDTNPNHKEKLKICSSVYTKKSDLVKFHSEYQEWLDNAGIKATVMISEKGEGWKANYKSVSELKAHTKNEIELQKKVHSLELENAGLKAQLKDISCDRWGGGGSWNQDIQL